MNNALYSVSLRDVQILAACCVN